MKLHTEAGGGTWGVGRCTQAREAPHRGVDCVATAVDAAYTPTPTPLHLVLAPGALVVGDAAHTDATSRDAEVHRYVYVCIWRACVRASLTVRPHPDMTRCRCREAMWAASVCGRVRTCEEPARLP